MLCYVEMARLSCTFRFTSNSVILSRNLSHGVKWLSGLAGIIVELNDRNTIFWIKSRVLTEVIRTNFVRYWNNRQHILRKQSDNSYYKDYCDGKTIIGLRIDFLWSL